MDPNDPALQQMLNQYGQQIAQQMAQQMAAQQQANAQQMGQLAQAFNDLLAQVQNGAHAAPSSRSSCSRRTCRSTRPSSPSTGRSSPIPTSSLLSSSQAKQVQWSSGKGHKCRHMALFTRNEL